MQAAAAASTPAGPIALDAAGPASPVPHPVPSVGPPYAVRPEWIDDNGHMNLAYYVVLFDWATDHLWTAIGLGDPFRATGHGTFAAESHILFKAELVADEVVQVRSLVLGADEKRLHVAHEMWRVRDGQIAAQQELMFLSVDLGTRRVAPFSAPFARGLQAVAIAHAAAPLPGWTGSRIAMPARPA